MDECKPLAHGHLAKAFDGSTAARNMTAPLRQKTGQLALKCVSHALPVAESLMNHWVAPGG